MSDDQELKRCMEAAVAAEDFETAARLRDELSALRRQVPGKMGLGTDQPGHRPPPGWAPPPKPDLMTTRRKPRGGKA